MKKNFMKICSSWGSDIRFAGVGLVLGLSIILAACGGGADAPAGGGGTTPPPPVATAPVLKIANVSPISVGSTIVVSSDKVLTGVTMAVVTTPANVSLPENATLSADKKSVILTMSAPMPYDTSLAVTVKATADGLEGSVTGTLLTETKPMVCPANAYLYANKACVYPQLVENAIPAVELPASMTLVTDTAFLASTGSGGSLLIDIGAKIAGATNPTDRTRDIVLAVYRYAGKYVKKPLFKDTLRGILGHDGLLEDALVGSNIEDRFQGTPEGLLFRWQPGNQCYLAKPDGTGFGVFSSSVCSFQTP